MSNFSEQVSEKAKEQETPKISEKFEDAPKILGGTKLRQLTKISASQPQVVKIGGDISDVSMTSFNFLGKTKHTIPAYVNILSISRQFQSFVDKKADFLSQLHLVRGSPTYQIFVLPASGGNGSQHPVDKLETLRPGNKKNSLYAEFEEGVFIIVQFKHTEHYIYFKKILEEVLRMKKEQNEKKEGEEQEYVPENVCRYRVKRGGSSKSGLFLSGGISTGISDNSAQFYTKKAEEWMPQQVRDWLDLIFIQPRHSTKIISVLEYLKQNKGFYEDLMSYFEMDSGTYASLLKQISLFQRQREKCKRKLYRIFDDRLLIRTLRRECLNLRRRNGMFNINMAIVLLKRIDQVKKYVDSGMYHLTDLIQNLSFEKRYWWDVEDCRDYILSILLFRKEFTTVIEDFENEFFELEKERFGDNWTSKEDKALGLPPAEWADMLEEYNAKILMDLERVSFRIFLSNEQNKLRIQRDEYISARFQPSEQLQQLQNRVTTIEGNLKTLTGRAEMIENRISTLSKKSGQEAAVEKLRNMLGGTATKMNGLGSIKKELNFKVLEKMKEEMGSFSESDENIKDLNELILDKSHDNEYLDEDITEFSENPRRRLIIRKFLCDRLKAIGLQQGMSEFTVKLVISILREHSPARWQRKILGALDKFWTPSWCKWGFIHANVQVANLGCHWFSNNLVMVSELSVGRQYEELIAIDCHCPLLVNVNTMLKRTTKLAEEIVSTNVNYKYGLINFWGAEGKLNCQEFTDRMISALDYTDFFPVVKSYLDSLKQILVRTATQQSRNLRYLDLTTIPDSANFRKIFATVFVEMGKRFWNHMKYIEKNLKEVKASEEDGEEQEELKKKEKFDIKKVKYNKNRVYFNTHGDVDEFYHCCLEIDNSFDMNYPGVYQLIKGFDRSFWMRTNSAGERGEEEIIKPGERGCKFTYEVSQAPTELKIDDDEEVEGEGELEKVNI